MPTHDLPRARCWLEVDAAAVAHNLRLAQSLLRPGVCLIAVLKADAYGLGLPAIARLLWEKGVRHFAVACLEEAFLLREALPDAWVLCLGETLEGNLDDAVRQGVRLTAGSADAMRRASGAAARAGVPAFLHCKVDTGLHRIGFSADTAAGEIAPCAALPGIRIEGIYTHLALHDRESDEAQHAAFCAVLDGLKKRGIALPLPHMLDSIGLTRYPAWQYRAVRVGALLFGNPPRGFDRAGEALPTARFCARVARVFTVPAGGRIGYDDAHFLPRETRVAALSVGYADGYPRALSGIGEVEIRGHRARCLGLVCMDQMMVDVTGIDGARPGDVAVLLGGGISLTEYAAWGRLNRNECTAVISRRVPRVYVPGAE